MIQSAHHEPGGSSVTADGSWNGRYFPAMGVGFIAIALVATGCAEKQRFAKQGATKETRTLVVPARITPPVTRLIITPGSNFAP